MTIRKNEIGNLTTEEFGKLFPIVIVPYDNSWTDLFKSESELITNTLGNDVALRIEHFGSTAVEGLSAKPTIDILVEIPHLTNELKEMIISRMKAIGYHFIWRTDDKNPYMNFVKGYTPEGYSGNQFHIHMGDKSHSLWDRIYFRDYLRRHKNTAREYETLKLQLASKFRFDREAYTNAKAEFVNRITAIAKNEND